MSTVATAAIRQLATDWRTKCGYKSATLSGIVGDAAHAARGGYHRSREDNPAGNFSIVRPDDLTGPSDAAAAIDMTLNASDMRLVTGRLVQAYTNLKDPRRKYINAFNGTVDSKNARRWDVYAQKQKAATSDHLSHVHLEVRRRYVESATAMAAILSILKGETVSQFSQSVNGSVLVASTSGLSTAPPFPGTIKRGSSGPSVKLFQSQLIKRGVTSIGSADGSFGPKSESAVKVLQKLAGYTADGIVGPKTWPLPWTAKNVK